MSSQRSRQRLVEVDDGTFVVAEGEGVVGAAAEPALDRLHHRTVLLRAGVADEIGVALGFGQRRRIVAAAVGQRVGDLPRAIDASGSRITTLVWRDSTVISTLGNR